MSLTEARASLGDLVARAEYGGETVFLSRHGRRAAALVPAGVAEQLKQVKDLLDSRAVAEVQARLAAGTESRRRFVTAEPAADAAG